MKFFGALIWSLQLLSKTKEYIQYFNTLSQDYKIFTRSGLPFDSNEAIFNVSR